VKILKWILKMRRRRNNITLTATYDITSEENTKCILNCDMELAKSTEMHVPQQIRNSKNYRLNQME
jgi:hypothetical protein